MAKKSVQIKKTNTMSILGLIFAFVCPLLGLIFSIIALSQIKKTNEEGKGLATAGLVISIAGMIIIVILVLIQLSMFW